MSKYTATMQRNEKKYCLNRMQYQKFISAIARYTEEDPYGQHTISNIYLDDEHFESISRSMSKPLYKEKLRLRSYAIPSNDDTVYLEIKKKFSGVVYKRRVAMCLNEANNYLFKNHQTKIDSQVLSEFDWIKASQKLKPSMFIAYNRQAYYAFDDKHTRITLDEDIRWRSSCLGLEQGNQGNYVCRDIVVLEIKVADAIPLWLSKILDELMIYPRSFSKYTQCYMDFIQRKEAL